MIAFLFLLLLCCLLFCLETHSYKITKLFIYDTFCKKNVTGYRGIKI